MIRAHAGQMTQQRHSIPLKAVLKSKHSTYIFKCCTDTFKYSLITLIKYRYLKCHTNILNVVPKPQNAILIHLNNVLILVNAVLIPPATVLML